MKIKKSNKFKRILMNENYNQSKIRVYLKNTLIYLAFFAQ